MIKIPQFNISSFNIMPSFKGKNQSYLNTTSPLERSPKTDTVTISFKSQSSQDTALQNYKKVVKENILGPELNSLLEPQTDKNGNYIFDKDQIRVLKLAAKKIDFYKEIASRLEKEGNDSIDFILKQTKKVFGGEKELGKYLRSRQKDGKSVSKDAVSIYNKLIKEFKDEYIKGNILNGFSMPHFQKPYTKLDKDEKELIKLYLQDKNLNHSIELSDLEKVLKTTAKDKEEAINWIRDLIGLRLILPDDFDMKQVEKYLTNAISKGELNITKISNYHSSHIYPYISQDTLKMWQQLSPGIVIASSSNILKKNGYTTTQMNIIFKVPDKNGKEKTVRAELQIRSDSLNKLGQIEHLIYDILENKNIGKDIKELDEFYQSTGIVKAVKEVFNNAQKENAYLEYEKTTYAKIRENEQKTKKDRQENNYPLLADFGLGQYDVLSFESLEYIDKRAEQIKQKYGNKN